jgi:alpha-tubulin suppressor-like RCC1 family protein
VNPKMILGRSLSLAFALEACAGSPTPASQGPTVIAVRADLQLNESQLGTAQGRPQAPRVSRPPRTDALQTADAGLEPARPARTRCYADDERHPQDVVDLSSGRWHTCVVLRDNTVRCWGWNNDGQLGDGTRSGHDAPIVVQGLRDVAEVRAAWDFTCARARDGAVHCWGENDYGQLGDGDRHARAEPTLVRGISRAQQLVLGSTHACALVAGGGVRCWGRNEHGELADGSEALRDRPVTAQFGRGVTEVAAGEGGTCALREDGSVRCAGWLARGSAPQRVEGLPLGIVDVAVAKNFACANTVDDELRCWGEGFVGQLGGENTGAGEVFVPRAIAGLRGVAQMALGPRGGCAVRRDGQLWCWGRVGIAARRSRSVDETQGLPPYRVSALEGVAQVSVGDDFVCARMTAGGVCCFGDGHMGQLGHNSNRDAPESDPAPVRW